MLIGVADDGTLHGLASDYTSLHKESKSDGDVFLLHFNQTLINAVGETAASTVLVGLRLTQSHISLF